MDYIQGTQRSKDCFLCQAAGAESDDGSMVVYRGSRVFTILNLYPYTSGHLMVVPCQHVNTVEALESETLSEMMQVIARAVTVLRSVYQPEAFNIGANIGAAAGAGLAEHIHFHVVPRWNGDTNFMSSVAGTRVLPETLADTYRRVRQAWSSG